MNRSLYRIYTLSDYKGNVFYVGATLKSLSKRLCGHIWEAKTNHGNHTKNRIIEMLNYEINIKEVDQISSVSFKKVKDLETAWIYTYSTMGFKLCNICQTYY